LHRALRPGANGFLLFRALIFSELSGTKVTDAGLKELTPLKVLTTLGPNGNQVTDAGVAA
jgi:internalin A